MTGGPSEQAVDLKALLMAEAVGRDNAITIRDAGQRIGMYDGEGSPNIRAVRDEVIDHYGVPICTVAGGDNPGMFVATSPEDIVEYQASLRERAARIEERADLMADVWDEWTGEVDQATFESFGGVEGEAPE